MNDDVRKVVARILRDIRVEMSDEFDKISSDRLFSPNHGSVGKVPHVPEIPY